MATQPSRRGMKASLACDTCRKRKSRCDGRLPTCTFCETAGKPCVYRPTQTSLTNDTNLLTRLAQVERNIELLQQGISQGQPQPSFPTPGSVEESQMPHDELQAIARLPELHTAATFRMPHCWPTLAVGLRIPDFDPLQSLLSGDSRSPFDLGVSADSTILPYDWAISAVENLYRSPDIEIDLLLLLNHCPPLHRDYVLHQLTSRPDDDGNINLTLCEISELLIITIALYRSRHNGSGADSTGLGEPFPRDTAYEKTFKVALTMMWKLQFSPAEMGIALTQLLTVIFLTCFFRPFHALRTIELSGDRLGRSAQGKREAFATPALWLTYAKVQFIQENDLLTQIDGSPSSAGIETIGVMPEGPRIASGLPSNNIYLPSEFDIISEHLWLRAHLNKTLAELYTTDQAYCHPDNIEQIVTTQERCLDDWYHRLPLRERFPRDVSGLQISSASGVIFTHSSLLALRYYNCSYMLHRPILYFVAHENMERSVSGLETNYQQGLNNQASTFRLLESSRRCLQCAALLILSINELSATGHQTLTNNHTRSLFNCGWIEMQTIIGAAMSLIVARANPSLQFILRDCGDPEAIDRILDMSEAIVQNVVKEIPSSQMNYLILSTIRQNLHRPPNVI